MLHSKIAMNVKLVYLHRVLEEEIYMEQPEGFIAQGEENKVCKLVRSLYGDEPAHLVPTYTILFSLSYHFPSVADTPAT